MRSLGPRGGASWAVDDASCPTAGGKSDRRRRPMVPFEAGQSFLKGDVPNGTLLVVELSAGGFVPSAAKGT